MKHSIQLWTESDALRNSALKPSGVMVHSTATPGVSAQRFRDLWNKKGVGASVHYFVDDVHVIQCLPHNIRAGHCAGAGNKTHLAFEICEPSGLKYNRNGSAIIEYNPPEEYFQKAWVNAVWLTAALCSEFGLDPLKDVLSHAEGYKKGIASNHADTGHWFKLENKTMDDFRQDVKKAMEKDTKREAGEWSEAARNWAIEKGLFVGDGENNFRWTDNITREEMAVLLLRFSKL